MSKNLTNASYRASQDLFSKLGIDSSFPVVSALNGNIWETKAKGNPTRSADSGYSFEAEIGAPAGEKVLPDNFFDRFVARTYEQGAYSSDEPLEWYDGLITVNEHRSHDYFDLTAGELPYDTVEFLPVPYNSRQETSSGFDADDWKVT